MAPCSATVASRMPARITRGGPCRRARTATSPGEAVRVDDREDVVGGEGDVDREQRFEDARAQEEAEHRHPPTEVDRHGDDRYGQGGDGYEDAAPDAPDGRLAQAREEERKERRDRGRDVAIGFARVLVRSCRPFEWAACHKPGAAVESRFPNLAVVPAIERSGLADHARAARSRRFPRRIWRIVGRSVIRRSPARSRLRATPQRPDPAGDSGSARARRRSPATRARGPSRRPGPRRARRSPPARGSRPRRRSRRDRRPGTLRTRRAGASGSCPRRCRRT